MHHKRHARLPPSAPGACSAPDALVGDGQLAPDVAGLLQLEPRLVQLHEGEGVRVEGVWMEKQWFGGW